MMPIPTMPTRAPLLLAIIPLTALPAHAGLPEWQAAVQDNVDLHVVYTSNGTDTSIFLNGALADTMTGFALNLTGSQGLGAARNGTDDGFFDVLVGNIYGFASYNSALSAGEIQSHYNAFTAIPEPAAIGLAALAGLAGLSRRRR
ncbi:MAG: PEP-CTERM sorting domain-containing protein [Verrucomicrobiales bacterium]